MRALNLHWCSTEEACRGRRFQVRGKELQPYETIYQGGRSDCEPSSHAMEFLETMEGHLNESGFLDTVTGPQERRLLSVAESNAVMLSALYPLKEMPPNGSVNGCVDALARVSNQQWKFTAVPAPRPYGRQVPHVELDLPSTFVQGLFAPGEAVSWWMLSSFHFLWAFSRNAGVGSPVKFSKYCRSREQWLWKRNLQQTP